MTIPGVDYSFARPGGAALAAAGKVFAGRYLAYRHATAAAERKFLTSDEVADLHIHGIAIVANFESTIGRALVAGYDGGATDAFDAKAALRALGAPDGLPVYFSVDTDVTAAQWPAIDAYLHGAGSVLGAAAVGVYGERDLLAHCKAVGSARWFWQTAALGWSPAGTAFPGSHIVQGPNGQTINGAEVDFDRALVDNYGAWLPAGLPATSTGEDMPIIVGAQRVVADVAAGTPYFDRPNGARIGTTAAGVVEWLGSPTLDGVNRDMDWALIVSLEADGVTRNVPVGATGIARYVPRQSLSNVRPIALVAAGDVISAVAAAVASYKARLAAQNQLFGEIAQRATAGMQEH